MTDDDIASYTCGIAQRMFSDTADQNYLGARAAYWEGRHYDFWWLSLHALEKYLKAILLMNGRAAMQSHDLVGLLSDVKSLDARLAPPPFVRPTFAGMNDWPCVSDEQFLKRLVEYGSTDNRYGTYGYTVFLGDLMQMDQLVFWARRHARCLTQHLWTGQTIDWVHELGMSPREWVNHAGPLEEVARLHHSDRRRWTLVRLNGPFFPRVRHRVAGWTTAASNPAIAMWCSELQNAVPGSDVHDRARRVLEWVLTHIRLGRDDKRELAKFVSEHV